MDWTPHGTPQHPVQQGEDNSLLLRRAFEGAVVEAARRAHLPHTRHGLHNARLICRPETSWIKR